MTDEFKATELTNEELEKAAGGAEYYIVKPGDTLGKIAKEYGTTWQKLAKCNHIQNPNLIHPGEIIKICY